MLAADKRFLTMLKVMTVIVIMMISKNSVTKFKDKKIASDVFDNRERRLEVRVSPRIKEQKFQEKFAHTE